VPLSLYAGKKTLRLDGAADVLFGEPALVLRLHVHPPLYRKLERLPALFQQSDRLGVLHPLEARADELLQAIHGLLVDPLDERLLRGLRELAGRVEPAYVSDHLCWGRHGGRYAHDLLPLPYTEEALAHVVSRVRRVQDALGRQLLLENVSSYLAYTSSTMTEWEFLARIAEEADCGILLDVNNVYVSARNHAFDPDAYLAGIPVDRVGQFHLAGHSDQGTHVLDTHDAPVVAAVWELYRSALRRFGRVPALIEWDDHIPELERVVEESRRAREVETEVLG